MDRSNDVQGPRRAATGPAKLRRACGETEVELTQNMLLGLMVVIWISFALWFSWHLWSFNGGLTGLNGMIMVMDS